MKYEAQKFCKESYNQNDSKAKELVCNCLVSEGYKIINKEEDFHHDIIAEKENKKLYIEVEFKIGYLFTNKESFRFNTVSFLGRKERLHKIHPFMYVIICKETNWALACNSDKIFKDEYKEYLSIDVANRKGKDLMFRVPKKDCIFFKL